MLRNYFKSAYRSLMRNKTHALIIILGLAVGLAAVFIIALFLEHEYSFDRFLRDSQKITRVVSIHERDGTRSPYTFEDIAAETRGSIPEIVAATKFYAYNTLPVYRDDINTGNFRTLYSDSSFFDVFSLEIVQGDPLGELGKPGTVVLTRSMKKRIFGSDPAINQVLRMGRKDYVVRGIMQDIPANCHLQFDALISFNSLSSSFREDNAIDYPTYFRFREDPGPEVRKKVARFVAGWVNEKLAPYDISIRAELQPLEAIHMSTGLNRDYAIKGDQQQMVIFSVVALFILVIAVFNFLNLFTAQSEGRLREVGIRKVIGSRRSQLIRQFLGESVLIGLLAFMVGMLLVETFLPAFFGLLQVNYEFSYASSWGMVLVFLLFTLVAGMASAWYPALYVSSFNPVRIFQGSMQGGGRGRYLRTALVVLQFTLSIGLITSIITIYSQVQYMKNKDVGFDREHVVYLYGYTSKIEQQYESVRAELLRNPRISAVTASMTIPASGRSQMNMRRPEQNPQQAFECKENRVQPGYLNTYGIELLKGQDFTAPHDKGDILINQAAARKLGYDDPLGREVILWKRSCRIIGVVKDYHFRSLHREIEPLVLSHYYDIKQAISVRAAGGFDQPLLKHIEGVFQSYDPHCKFHYQFIDQRFASLYGKEERLSTLILIAAGLGILLSVIGLYAFVVLMLNKRTKEMGIRKAFGAASKDVSGVVVKTIGRWILIAALLGWPLAYIFSSGWLGHFPYRIDLQWWMFAASAGLVCFLAAVAVAGKIWRLARVNPSDILRYE